ncbi:hypothetical protein ENSA7_01410 [Enhygromyxa salina]|uniref:Uncharacterized protein n=1 Tax=Enhygromyxa salina TaxID=215803 RepID=A0A2S9YYP6_9BACT|nr:hypothetical protein ENSA7_01410 [Enhygromyxa salina]
MFRLLELGGEREVHPKLPGISGDRQMTIELPLAIGVLRQWRQLDAKH